MAEQPVMDSATETLNESVAPTPKPLNTQGEVADALKNLLNSEASKTQETASEESTKEVSDSETNIEDAFEDDELIDQIEDEQPSDTNQELYRVVVDGQEQEVTLDELMKGYSRQSDYTRKTEKLSQERKALEERNAEALRRSEEAKIKRDQYEQQLHVLSQHLQASENSVDLDQLYRDDPAEYVRAKAEQDRRKELLQASIQEQERIRSEKQEEQSKNYNVYFGTIVSLLDASSRTLYSYTVNCLVCFLKHGKPCEKKIRTPDFQQRTALQFHRIASIDDYPIYIGRPA